MYMRFYESHHFYLLRFGAPQAALAAAGSGVIPVGKGFQNGPDTSGAGCGQEGKNIHQGMVTEIRLPFPAVHPVQKCGHIQNAGARRCEIRVQHFLFTSFHAQTIRLCGKPRQAGTGNKMITIPN